MRTHTHTYYEVVLIGCKHTNILCPTHWSEVQTHKPAHRSLTYCVLFTDLYELTGEVLGKGARSSVTTCIHKATRMEFAVKVVPKTTEHEREKVLREVEILYLSRENRYV